MEKTIEIMLDVFDDDGMVVDSTPADLTAGQIEDVVRQAVNVVNEADNGGTDLWVLIGELREALESYNLIDPK